MDSKQVVINRDRLEDRFALADTERGSGRGLQAAARTRNVPHRIMLQTICNSGSIARDCASVQL